MSVYDLQYELKHFTKKTDGRRDDWNDGLGDFDQLADRNSRSGPFHFDLIMIGKVR